MFTCDVCGKSAGSLNELPKDWRQVLLRDGEGTALQDALLCPVDAKNWCAAGDEKGFDVQ